MEKVRKLAGSIDDSEIARVLVMSGEETPAGLRRNKDRVTQFRRNHKIRLSKRDRSGIFTAEKAAEYLGISRRALIKLVRKGLVETNQVMSFAPWEIRQEQLDSEEVSEAMRNLRNTGQLFPDRGCSGNQRELFPDRNDTAEKN